jgi:hypothetical protein
MQFTFDAPAIRRVIGYLENFLGETKKMLEKQRRKDEKHEYVQMRTVYSGRKQWEEPLVTGLERDVRRYERRIADLKKQLEE